MKLKFWDGGDLERSKIRNLGGADVWKSISNSIKLKYKFNFRGSA